MSDPQTTADRPVGLEKWLSIEKRRLDEFAAHWLVETAKNPMHFPPALPLGEWDEQYRSWESE